MKKLTYLSFIILLTFIVEVSHAQNRFGTTMSRSLAPKAAYSGKLWCGVNNTPLVDAHVFAINENGEILAHFKTVRKPDSGWFQLLNLPVNTKIKIVGFHEGVKSNIAVKEIRTRAGYHDIKGITTSMGNYVSEEFGFIHNMNSINKNKNSASLADVLLYKLEHFENK